MNVQTGTSSTQKAAFITKMNPPMVDIALTKQGSRRAGAVSMTPDFRHHRQASSVHGYRLVN